MRKEIDLISVFIFLSISCMSACGFLGIGATEKWKEEVQLSNGQTIVIERKIINEMGGGEIVSNPSGLKPREYRMRFVNPDGSGKMIEWRTIKKSPRTYPEIPLILDVDSGKPVIFTLVGVRTACEAYCKYVYQNGTWIEEALPEILEPRMRNLFVRVIRDIPKFIDLETKRKIDDSGHIRRPVRQVGSNREICG